MKLLRIPIFIIKSIITLLRFIAGCVVIMLAHITGIVLGAGIGFKRGTSGMLSLGLRSFGVSLIKKY